MKKVNRVKKYREFKEILGKRRFLRNNLFTVYYRNNDYGFTRVGILITKKNGIAVIRNKIKRQIRMIVDEITDYTASYDIIIIVSRNYSTNEFNKNKDSLTEIFKTLLKGTK